ncbi:MAG: hypothetical protein WB679_09800 [Terracidiphilus sp.]
MIPSQAVFSASEFQVSICQPGNMGQDVRLNMNSFARERKCLRRQELGCLVFGQERINRPNLKVVDRDCHSGRTCLWCQESVKYEGQVFSEQIHPIAERLLN